MSFPPARNLPLLLLIFFSLAPAAFAVKFEPYGVLGVHRRASVQEIKAAYKAKVKEWHPDRNETPDATEKFHEITKAYELLSDPERRRLFDNHGITEDTPNFRQRHDYSQYNRFDTDGGATDDFSDFFGAGNGGGDGEHRVFHKSSITSKAYYHSVLPRSARQPYLIMFYSDWCFSCSKAEPTWANLVEELEPVGFGLAAVHTEHEKELARKLGAKELPYMVMLLDGKVVPYKDRHFSTVKVLEFIRRKLPYRMVDTVTDRSVLDFLSGWMDNRVRVLIFGHNDVIRLRYLATAFRYRNRAAIGYVNLQDPKCLKTVDRFKVSDTLTTLLVFQEFVPSSLDEYPRPVASAAFEQLDLSTIYSVIDAHPFLQLPRLSSQSVFDSLCPPGSARMRKRLCVTLFTSVSPEHEKYRVALREFSKRYKFSPERVRFTYVFVERQAAFVASFRNPTPLLGGGEAAVTIDPLLRVAILWRRDLSRVKYEWLESEWSPDSGEEESAAAAASVNSSHDSLRTTLQRLLTSNEVLTLETEVGKLSDEHVQSLFVRVADKMIEAVEFLREMVTKEDLWAAVTLVATVCAVGAVAYVMHYAVKMEEESVQRRLGAKGLKVDRKGKVVPELKIHELRAETYNGMVRLLKPGCRTIVLIVDRESKEKLVPKFYKFAWPFRRNKTVMFGFLYIEKGLPWYKRILNLTLPEPRDININPKNCIGTVLSLNGHRRYFCMYHAKHPEGSRKKIYTYNNGAVAGAFLGLDSELEEEETSETDIECQREGPQRRQARLATTTAPAAATAAPLLDSPDHLPIFEDQLLDGLQAWLDRLFEGSTYRYHINYWPEFPISPSNFVRS